MNRLVNVSNRVAVPKGTSAAGGLAVGVLAAMRSTGGMWFGWSGETGPDELAVGEARTVVRDGITFATVDLPEALHERSYSGFSNGTLWPLCHYFLDGFHYRAEEYQAYQAVNELFASRLRPLLREGDTIWIHDYHLIPLAEKLRAAGVRAPLGFFLHIPFPHYEVLRALPKCRELMRALLAFDVVGFQTEVDRNAFLGAVQEIWGPACITAAGGVELTDRTVLTGVFPIGVDVDSVALTASKALTSERVRTMREIGRAHV